MPHTQGSLLLAVYAPVLRGNDDRTVAIVHGMERALRDVRMAWRVSDEGKPVALPQRDHWLAEAAARREFPLVCNGDESYPATIFGLETSARSAPGKQPLLDVHAELPLDEKVVVAAVELLEAVAEGAHAMWGHATPSNAAQAITQQIARPVYGPHVPPRGLPILKLPSDLESPEIPYRLGWLNYWSAATARRLRFPDPARDAELLSRSRRTATDGWIVPLTEAPLDLDRPQHLDALLRAYDRFPEIGGRDAPS